MSDQTNNCITLYTHLSSPYAKRVELALAEAGVEFDSHIIDLVRKPDWYIREVNPAGKVPALSYGPPVPSSFCALPPPGSFHLAESLVILSFLADLYPSLLPPTPVDRARARFFITRVQEKLVPVWFDAITTGEVGLERLVEALEDVQGLLREDTENENDDREDTDYAAGRWSIADASISPFLYLTEVYLRNDAGAYPPGSGSIVWSEIFESERFGRLQAYYERCRARESWSVMTDERYMLAFLPKFMAYMGVRRKEART